MSTSPPRSSSGAFEQIHQIYYGTDDGFARLDPREERVHDEAHVRGLYEIFARFEKFYEGVDPARRQQIHLASVVGGLYGLNLIPLFKPQRITLFDINPYAVDFGRLIRRVWIESDTAEQFLGKLAAADYDVDTRQDEIIRGCIAERQNGVLTEERGRSARSLLSSWRYALDHFSETRRILAEADFQTRVEGMESDSFRQFVAAEPDLWLYCSNVILFSFFDLTFGQPQNAAVLACYFDQTEMLDLAGRGPGPATVHCRLPMSIDS